MTKISNSKFTDYQECWVGKFEDEKEKLLGAFGDIALEIEHSKKLCEDSDWEKIERYGKIFSRFISG